MCYGVWPINPVLPLHGMREFLQTIVFFSALGVVAVVESKPESA